MTASVHAVEIPALDGRTPVGFLAALGLLEILGGTEREPVRLSFSDASGAAVVHSDLTSADEIAAKLEDLVAATDDDAAIVGIDKHFPPEAGIGSDPLRRSRDRYRELVAEIGRIDRRAAELWLPHLITDLAVDQQGRADITPFSAPSGQQKLRTFFAKPLAAVRANPGRIREALVGWRRVEGFTGEYLDHRVIASAADDPLGRRGGERGVPGATWLATMSLSLLRITGDGRNVSATLWQRTGRRSLMIWPLWRRPLDRYAVQTLIEHPSLRLITVDSGVAVRRQDWHALGVFGVYGAERQRIPGRNFAGVLAPVHVQAVVQRSERHQ